MQIRRFVKEMASPEDETLTACRQLSNKENIGAIVSRVPTGFFMVWQTWAETTSPSTGL